MRHISPKTQNNYTSNFLKSPKKRQFNIITLDNKDNNDLFLNKKNYNNNNHLNFNYNKNNYNYYEEITKAFNFITFVLKQKDLQIQELKIKIKDLEKQLNEINETNIMTFNNQEVINISSNESNLKFLKNNKNIANKFQNKLNSIQDKDKATNCNSQLEINNNSNNTSNNTNIINFYKNNNFGNETNKNNISSKNIYDNSNISIIHKIKNSSNRVNDYRNATDLGKKNINFNINYNNKFLNDDITNINTNEHSNEKKNINKIRKESYHSSQNININIKNKNRYIKQAKNLESKNVNIISDNENITEQDKIKILTLNNYEKFERSGSKSNSFNLSDDGNMIISKKDVKNYLKEVKNKLEPEKFKKFIIHIKNLTKNKSIEERNIIILQIKNLLVDKILINKFENIVKGNKK